MAIEEPNLIWAGVLAYLNNADTLASNSSIAALDSAALGDLPTTTFRLVTALYATNAAIAEIRVYLSKINSSDRELLFQLLASETQQTPRTSKYDFSTDVNNYVI